MKKVINFISEPLWVIHMRSSDIIKALLFSGRSKVFEGVVLIYCGRPLPIHLNHRWERVGKGRRTKLGCGAITRQKWRDQEQFCEVFK